MEYLLFLVAFMFALVGLVCVALVVVGLPGIWMMILFAVVIELADSLYLPAGRTQTFSWWILGVCLALALAAEVVELLASAAGAKVGGASRRGMLGSLVGAVIGAIGGTVLILIPVVGSILGAMLGAALGAIIGEMTTPGMQLRAVWRPASGAAAGRLAGTLGKIPFAIMVWLLLTVAAFWP